MTEKQNKGRTVRDVEDMLRIHPTDSEIYITLEKGGSLWFTVDTPDGAPYSSSMTFRKVKGQRRYE